MTPLASVAVTGSRGLIGTALCESLARDGVRVVRVVRSNAGPDDVLWDPAAGTIDSARLEGVDGVVHLAGEGIAEKKWTEAHKREVLASRVNGTNTLSNALAVMKRKPYVFASGSAIGFYGDRGDEMLDETSLLGNGFLASVVQAWEEAAEPAKATGIRVAYLRTGIVLSTKGGALKQQLLPFKLGLGGRLGSGRQYLPWISLDDEVAAIKYVLLTSAIEGPVNLTSPDPVTNAVFTKSLGKALRRPTLLPIPLTPLKLRYGTEMVKEMLLSSSRVLPKKLLGNGFTFTHTNLPDALDYLLRTNG